MLGNDVEKLFHTLQKHREYKVAMVTVYEFSEINTCKSIVRYIVNLQIASILHWLVTMVTFIMRMCYLKHDKHM